MSLRRLTLEALAGSDRSYHKLSIWSLKAAHAAGLSNSIGRSSLALGSELWSGRFWRSGAPGSIGWRRQLCSCRLGRRTGGRPRQGHLILRVRSDLVTYSDTLYWYQITTQARSCHGFKLRTTSMDKGSAESRNVYRLYFPPTMPFKVCCYCSGQHSFS